MQRVNLRLLGVKTIVNPSAEIFHVDKHLAGIAIVHFSRNPGITNKTVVEHLIDRVDALKEKENDAKVDKWKERLKGQANR